jgi:two-component system sensor histidine kinase KdpD
MPAVLGWAEVEIVRSAWVLRPLRLLATSAVIGGITVVAFESHAKAFVAGFLYLFPLMLIAFRWGIVEASVGSVAAVGCLDYFFTQPLLHFYMSDPQDWIALSCFEAVVLVTSRLAGQLRAYAFTADEHRKHIETLYRLSRDLLFLHPNRAPATSLVRLIGEVFSMRGVSLLDIEGEGLETWGSPVFEKAELHAISDGAKYPDQPAAGRFGRVLLHGSRPIGSLGLWADPELRSIDAGGADAIASLAAIALARWHSHRTAFEAEAMKRNEQLRSALLDGLAHAFKTPLATIQSASSGLMETGLANPAQGELAAIINQESIRLSDLAAEALRTARRDAETMEPHRENVRIDSLLNRFRDELDWAVAQHRLEISCGNPATMVSADPQMLCVALSQLVENAAKYGSDSTPIAVLGTESAAEIVISVRNSGSYIPPEERPKIFRRFYRSPSSAAHTPGTGIGLFIVKKIVEAHGGRVWVESDPEGSTEVFLGLPRTEGGQSCGGTGKQGN